MSRIRNQKIGFVFQSFNLIPDLDVFDNVDVPLRYRGLPAADRKERIERALALVGLSSRLRHLPSQLSGGQQQRVAIARVLAGDPRLILADEPTGNLDSLMTREIIDLLEDINGRGTTIVMVTHSPECAARAHRQIHLLDGKVVDFDAAPTLRREETAVRPLAPCSSTICASPGRACVAASASPPWWWAASRSASASPRSSRPSATRWRRTPSRRRAASSTTCGWTPGTRPRPHPNKAGLPQQITYRDMAEIMKSDIPLRQSGMYKANLYVFPEPGAGRPTRTLTRMCFADFFPMFDVPFKYGSGWDRAADLGPEPVVVLERRRTTSCSAARTASARRSASRTATFRVVGVLDTWRPSVKFYDITQQAVQPPEQLFMPFGLMRPMQIRTSGNSDGWKSAPVPGFEGLFVSEAAWIQMWVELPDQDARARYTDFLKAYATEQKTHGRFARPLRVEVTPLLEWLSEQEVTPRELTVMLVVSLLFLAVCALNLMGLLLAKFLARAPEIGVRRALGAVAQAGLRAARRGVRARRPARRGAGRPAVAGRGGGRERLAQDDGEPERPRPLRRQHGRVRVRALAAGGPAGGRLSRLARVPHPARPCT